MFFANPGESLGRASMPVESEARALPSFAAYVENARFTKNDVLFVTLNIPGSNNGFETTDPRAAAEYFERNRANLAWLADSFEKAKETNAKAVVLIFQAYLWDIPRSRHDPKILWVDDAEIVGDRITKVRPIPRNLFTQKTERRIGELGASCVALVVSDVSVHEAP